MDESKRPSNYLLEPDLLEIQPSPYDASDPNSPSFSSTAKSQTRRPPPSTEADSGGRTSGRSGSHCVGHQDSSMRWIPGKNSIY
ncbi:hypothetical protein CDL15_Pgr020898 [Punica granatum]|uniref:Uncharacterized protein n=1 Tax=Punica granatum TaxID=22663 RepID=A0A218XVF7_PUNGR|nr:hypothetical protein CDL15_Pgr020898 [Punica granatum]PKI78084.1 hypothetical protein CRG98_001534 [Punica granatum]